MSPPYPAREVIDIDISMRNMKISDDENHSILISSGGGGEEEKRYKLLVYLIFVNILSKC